MTTNELAEILRRYVAMRDFHHEGKPLSELPQEVLDILWLVHKAYEADLNAAIALAETADKEG